MEIEYIIIHHSAVSILKNSEQFDAINNYHKRKGWGMIGYHYLIEPNGKLKSGRNEGTIGAHCIGRNHDSLGICLTGNFDIESPTKEQEKSLKNLLSNLMILYPEAQIKYHRDFANKTCPGKLIADDWAKDLISDDETKTMILVIDKNDDQYLVEEACKFGVSIADPDMLSEIVGHFSKLGITLESPELTDMAPYFIIHGATAKKIKEFFNIQLNSKIESEVI